jgi:hypothetical protein
MNQLGRKLWQAIQFLLGKSVLDDEILSLVQSNLAQLLPERIYEDRHPGSRARIEEANAEDFPCVLRVGHRATDDCEGESKDQKPRPFWILDCRFWIVGPNPKSSNESFVFHDFFSIITVSAAQSSIPSPSTGEGQDRGAVLHRGRKSPLL